MEKPIEDASELALEAARSLSTSVVRFGILKTGSMKALIRTTGVDQRTLYRGLYGGKELRVSTMMQLAWGLGYTYAELIMESQQKLQATG